MKIKFKVALLWVITLFFSLMISQRANAVDEQQWQSVPEANYADVLELIALRSKANYEEISSWQGRMNIHETIHYYGPNAAEKSHAVDTTSIARNSQHICEIEETIAEFVLDMYNDKICSSVEPNVQFKAVDLGEYVPIRKSTRIPKTRTVLSPESYMWCMPDLKFNPTFHKGRLGKTIFIESPQNEDIKGFVRDPRLLFNSGGENRKLWETLLKIRSNMSKRLKERVAGYPHIEITSRESSDGIKYRILTTWRGGGAYVIKYIRALLEVDETVGFNAIRTETTNSDGVKVDSKEYTYEKIGEIYLPKTVRKEFWNSKGEPTFTSEITIENTSVNKPLSEDTFTIKGLGLEEDTLVTNKIEQAEYRYSKGKLIPLGQDN